ncbi:MAG: hypothetical protein ABS902_05345 [Priestia megaterium]
MSDQFDFDAIAAEFDANYAEDATETVEDAETVEEKPETETVETTEQTETEVEPDETNTQTDDSEETETQQPPAEDEKRNAAFAELRRKAQEGEQASAFLHKLAEQSGLSPEDVLKRFEEQSLAAEAQQQNVPVDVLKRIKALEQENSSFKEQTATERMNTQVESVISKYGATDDDIRATFEEMFKAGLDPRTNDQANFESFYKAVNHEKIVAAEVAKAQQNSLANKKKRQEQAAIPTGTGTTQSGEADALDQAAKDAAEILANW